MIELMVISALVLIICISSTKVLYKFGVPMLLIFIILGMLFGSDGLIGIQFDNFELTSTLCSIGLVFITFYGGFGTNWKVAKSVAVPSILMSSLGVIITAGLTGLFCYYVINTSFLEGLLIGTVIASTDAASVFAVLRTQKLNLKGKLASMLEVESGVNDTISNIMMAVVLCMMSNPGTLTTTTAIALILKQLSIGLLVGYLLAKMTVHTLKRSHFEVEGFYTIFVVAIAMLSYSLSEILGGNGYLSAYIAGISIGNSKIPQKKSMFHFLDGVSWIMQIALFFILGLLSYPSKLINVQSTAILISMFLIFVARPLATFIILSPFKFTLKEKIFISWVGLRGAASVVFAIFATTYGVSIENDIFHIIFFIALFSVAIQGSLIPKVARALDLVDTEDTTAMLKTFTDYTGEINTDLIELRIDSDNEWSNKTIIDASIPDEVLIVMIKRNNKIIVPKGSTVIKPGDTLVLSGNDIKNIL